MEKIASQKKDRFKLQLKHGILKEFDGKTF